MAVDPNDMNDIRVDVLGTSVDRASTWTVTGPAGNRNALAATITERVVTRLLNAMYGDILGSVGATNGFADRFNSVIGDEAGADLAAFQSLGNNLIQIAATGAGRSFEYDQAIAATTWNVVHNLDRRYVAVQLLSAVGNVMIADVDFVDQNQLVVTFAVPRAGKAVVRR